MEERGYCLRRRQSPIRAFLQRDKIFLGATDAQSRAKAERNKNGPGVSGAVSSTCGINRYLPSRPCGLPTPVQ